MQRLMSGILILGFVSATLCLSSNAETKVKYFNVMDYGAHADGQTDDSNAISKAWQGVCGEEGPATLLIPSSKIFLVKRLNLSGPCKAPNVGIKFEGKIVAPSMNEWVGDSFSWIQILHVNGLTIDADGGIIDGNGSTWWEKCRNCTRPISLLFQSCNGLTVKSLRMRNSPGFHISVYGSNGALFTQININSPRKSPNTDGIDIFSSKNIAIEDSTLATGDDCIAIKGGSSYINATRIFCQGGHGISIGSLGINKSYETVEEVHVQNCSFIGTTNGARIKTWPTFNLSKPYKINFNTYLCV
ncbi:polygalacturonase [Vigna unguiculata]|uniref:Polygalacturonase n=1 Tax=Vigna unguiculata TaxID=3917 RepID=A0A4D6MXK3_VIGUN|nr:polygalacturonase [Vigna unguiculata]